MRCIAGWGSATWGPTSCSSGSSGARRRIHREVMDQPGPLGAVGLTAVRQRRAPDDQVPGRGGERLRAEALQVLLVGVAAVQFAQPIVDPVVKAWDTAEGALVGAGVGQIQDAL